MTSSLLSADRFNAWASAFGPSRLVLLGTLKRELTRPVPIPANHALIVEPLRWLLDEVASKRVLLTEHGLLTAEFAEPANLELGWGNLPLRLPDGGRRHLEVDAIHAIARHAELLRPKGKKAELTDEGRRLRGNPTQLWIASANRFGRLPDLLGVVTEIRLAGSLRVGEMDDATLDYWITRTLLEMIDEPLPERQQESLYWIKSAVATFDTMARALSMWNGEGNGSKLSAAGKAMAMTALQSCALSFTEPAATAWN